MNVDGLKLFEQLDIMCIFGHLQFVYSRISAMNNLLESHKTFCSYKSFLYVIWKIKAMILYPELLMYLKVSRLKK